MWWARVFFPWVVAWTLYWDTQWQRLAAYINTWIAAADEYITEHAISGYSWRTTATPINPGGATNVTITADVARPLVVGDFVSDQSANTRYGVITAVIDATHATVEYLGSLGGAVGLTGHGWWPTATAIAHAGDTAVILAAETDRAPQPGDFVVDQTDTHAYGLITVVTDPTHVTVSFVGVLSAATGGGVVDAVIAGAHINVDSTNPANPIVSTVGLIESIVAGSGVTVNNTDPANPIVSASGGCGGTVVAVVAGSNITVDSTDPTHPIVAAAGGTAFKRFATQALMNLSAAPALGDLAIVDAIPGAYFKYATLVGVTAWQMQGVAGPFPSAGAINAAITAPLEGMKAQSVAASSTLADGVVYVYSAPQLKWIPWESAWIGRTTPAVSGITITSAGRLIAEYRFVNGVYEERGVYVFDPSDTFTAIPRFVAQTGCFGEQASGRVNKAGGIMAHGHAVTASGGQFFDLVSDWLISTGQPGEDAQILFKTAVGSTSTMSGGSPISWATNDCLVWEYSLLLSPVYTTYFV